MPLGNIVCPARVIVQVRSLDLLTAHKGNFVALTTALLSGSVLDGFRLRGQGAHLFFVFLAFGLSLLASYPGGLSQDASAAQALILKTTY